MVVAPRHPEAVRTRRAVLALPLSMLNPSTDRGGFHEVGEAAERHGLARPGFPPHHRFAVDDSKSFFVLDREAGILCGRCTTPSGEVQHIGALSLVGKGELA